MPRWSHRRASGLSRRVAQRVLTAPFVELLRPAPAGRELVLEVEGVGGLRVRVTLRDGGRWRLAGLDAEGRHA